MQFKNQLLFQKTICEVHNECQEQLLGIRNADTVAIISQNKIVIISKGSPASKDKHSRISIRGRRIDSIMNQMKRDECHAFMKERLSVITGYTVLHIQSNIPLINEEKVDVYCFDKSFLTF
jgi:uncharacterized protein YbcI